MAELHPYYQERRAAIRRHAAWSKEKNCADDFVYDYVEPMPGESFDFGIDYKECGFCKFAQKMATRICCRISAARIMQPMKRAV